MPCIDDPCSNSPAILAAQSELVAAQLNAQRSPPGQRPGWVSRVETALAALDAVTLKCRNANHAATSSVESKGSLGLSSIVNLFGDPLHFTTQLVQAAWTPVLTFEPPFFTLVKPGTITEIGSDTAGPFMLPTLLGTTFAGRVNAITGIGSFSRCTGHMTLGVSFTTTTNAKQDPDGAVTPIPQELRTDTVMATLSTSFSGLSPVILNGLMGAAFDSVPFSNAPFTKQPDGTFIGGLTGFASVQGGALASLLASTPPTPMLLNLTMNMGAPFPLV
jgi:hypothetical protein